MAAIVPPAGGAGAAPMPRPNDKVSVNVAVEHGGWEEVWGHVSAAPVVKLSQSQQKSAFFPSEAGLWPAS